MSTEHLMIWSLAAAAWTGVLHLRGCQHGRSLTTEESASIVGHSRFVDRALVLLTTNFGSRFWTLRGFAMTIGTCWSVYGLAWLLSDDALLSGDGSYASLVAAFIVVYAVGIPPMVHVVVHTMRLCLRWVGTHFTLAERVYYSAFIVVVPMAVLVISLVPVSTFLVLIDGGSTLLRDWLTVTGSLIGMLTIGWLEPGTQTAFTLPALLLNGPLLVLLTLLVSYTIVAMGRAAVSRVFQISAGRDYIEWRALALVHMAVSAIAASGLYIRVY